MIHRKMQTFNDGVCDLYSTENVAGAGSLPVKKLVHKEGPLRYEERTVGVTRHYQALQHAETLTMILRVPRREGISALDVCIPRDGLQYEIKQVQHPADVVPPVCDLALERVVDTYDFA